MTETADPDVSCAPETSVIEAVIEAEGSRRAQALRDEVERGRRAVAEGALTGLRRMTAELEQLVGGPSHDGESLVDALEPYGQQLDTQAEPLAARPDRPTH